MPSGKKKANRTSKKAKRAGPARRTRGSKRAQARRRAPAQKKATARKKAPARKKARARKKAPARSIAPTPAVPPMRDFGPSVSAFSRITVEHFADLIRTLVREEAIALGVPATAVVALENAFTKDGGIDAEITVPPATSGTYLPSKRVIAQFKRGSLTAAGARKEIKKHKRVRALVRDGFAYRLILGADEGGLVLAKLKNVLTQELVKAGADRATLDVEVLAAGHLADWIAEYPALTGHIAFAAAGEPSLSPLLTFEAWRQQDHETTWRGEEGRNEELTGLVERLAERRAVVRVIGPPGAGKTRFVLEAISLADASDRTLYSPVFHDGLRDVFAKGSGVQRRKGILVVDECTSEQASQLEMYRHAGADLRIVTIGASDEVYARSSDPRVIALSPLQPKDAEHVAADRLPEGAKVHAPVIAVRSDGYPKLIVLICEVLARDPDAVLALAVGQHERLVGVLKRLLGSRGQGEPVQALCLPRQFGVDGPAAAEMDALASGTRVDVNDLKAAVEGLRRRALIGKAADFAYVTPFLLAEWLAGDLWRVRGAQLFIDLQTAKLSGRALRSTLRRLIDLGLEQHTADVARSLLASPQLFRDVADLDDDARASFVDELATLNPGAAGALLGRLLRAETRERLVKFEAGRRHVVWALQKCAWAQESFDVAASVLLRLASAENENWGNNATGVLRSLFLTHLGATEAPAEMRVNWLRAAWESSSDDERRLLLGAAQRALEIEGSGESCPFPDSIGRPDRWMPRTWEEEHHYRSGVAGIVLRGLSDESESVRAEADKVVGRSIRQLLARNHGDIAVELVTGMGDRARINGELARAIVQVKGFDVKRMGPSAAEAFARIQEFVAPTTSAERLAKAVRVAPWEAEEGVEPPPDFDGLAEFFVSEDARPWGVLEDADPQRVFEFGQALGRHDPGRLLLNELVSRAGDPRVLRILAAYVPCLPAVGQLGDGDDLLDSWVADPAMARAVLEATWLAAPSPRAVSRLVSLRKMGSVAEEEFSRLLYGGWLLRVSVEDALSVLAVLQSARAGFPLAFQLWHHSKPPDVAVTEACRKFWLRLGPADVSRRELAWEWQTFGSSLIDTEPVAAATAALRILEAADRGGIDDAAAELVAKAMRIDPERVWPLVSAALVAPDGRSVFRVATALSGKLDDENAIRVIIAWAKSDAANRRTAARLAGAPGSPGTVNLANALLESFPNDEVVMSEASRAYFSGSFAGPMSEHYKGMRDALIALREDAGLGLRAWADVAIRHAEGYLEMGRRMDESDKVDS